MIERPLKTIRGIVSIFDNVSKKYVIKDKHNIITNEGRNYILQKFLINTGLIPSTETLTYGPSSWFLSACVFGNKNNMVMPDMEYIPDDYIRDYDILITQEDVSFDSGERTIEFTLNLTGKAEAPTNITNLSLVITESANQVQNNLSKTTETKLFSKLLLPQLPLGAGTSHTITYSIYF